MEIDYYSFGKRLSIIRKSQNMTQAKLAEKCDLANNYISNIEKGRSIPSLETLVKLCLALNITPNDLLVGTSKSSALYLKDELMELIGKCTAEEKKLVEGIISLIIYYRQ